MPPLVMPCWTRKLSSVCTRTSKIALPIARTSYFAEAIDKIPLRQLRLRQKSDSTRALEPIRSREVACDLSRSSLREQAAQNQKHHDPLDPHRLDRNAGLPPAGIRPRCNGGGAARRGPGG